MSEPKESAWTRFWKNRQAKKEQKRREKIERLSAPTQRIVVDSAYIQGIDRGIAMAFDEGRMRGIERKAYELGVSETEERLKKLYERMEDHLIHNTTVPINMALVIQKLEKARELALAHGRKGHINPDARFWEGQVQVLEELRDENQAAE